jgi:putative membrane protein insertion efficiency factor
MKALLLALIGFWQRGVSRWLPPMCRFHPSCSRYTAEAISIWGPAHGSWLGFQRILRCQPFHPGGFDPVPMRPAVPEEIP